MDGFHAEVFKGDDASVLDGLADEVGGAADGDEVDGLVVADGVDGGDAALGFADHAEEAGGLEHLARELVHAGGGGGAGGADGFVTYGVDGANVVDELVGEVDREGFVAGEHVGHALVGGVAAGEELAVEEEDVAGLPGLGFGVGEGVEVDALGVVRFVRELGPVFEVRWVEVDGAVSVENEMRVARGGAVGDHGYREVGGVGGEVEDLDVEDGGEAAEALARRCRGR